MRGDELAEFDRSVGAWCREDERVEGDPWSVHERDAVGCDPDVSRHWIDGQPRWQCVEELLGAT